MGDLATLPNFQPSPSAYTHTDFNAVFQALTIAPGAVTVNKLGDGAVTLQKLQSIAQRQLFTRTTAGSGAPELLTLSADAFALLQGADKAALRTALGLGDSATKNIGTTAGTVAAGDAALNATSNLADVPDKPAARTNMGLGEADNPRFNGVIYKDAAADANHQLLRQIKLGGDWVMQLLNDDLTERVPVLRVDDNGNVLIEANRVLRLGSSYVNTPVTPTGYLTLQDKNGNSYRIPAVLGS